MIKSLKVTNHNGESLTLELFHPDKSGLAIWNIDGLGPPKATINSNEVAMIDGGIFTSARMEQRNIVITLVELWDPLIEDARQKTYKYFPIKKPVTLEITTDYRHAECTGYVESNEPDIFSSQEQSQISIICTDPYFYELGEEVMIFSGVEPLFEFIFSNESLTEPLLEFGNIREDNRAILDYKGNVDTGIRIVIHVMSGTPENIVIWNVHTRENMRINTMMIKRITDVQFGTGDDIEINTKIGSKSIRLLHNGVYHNIIACINKDADWFQLTTGPNTFTFTADSGASDMVMTFSYRNAYGGI